MSPLRNVLVGAVAFIAAVTGCGVSPQAETKETQPTMSQAQTPNALAAADTASALSRYAFAVFLSGVQASVQPQRLADPTPTVSPPIAMVAPESSSTASVMACIRDHESGNYSESSHLGAGSGAYQFTPGTWRAYYAMWRDAVAYVGSDYPYAYLAPPVIQDAVTEYALTHGGAGNWSMRFGNDPCTSGLPGGG